MAFDGTITFASNNTAKRNPIRMRLLPEPERYVVPLAAYVALRSYTSTQSDPTGSAESAFLALLIAGVLAVIAALGAARDGRRRGPELVATALLATAAVWIAYQGPSRGAVVSVILVIGLTVSAARVLLDARGRLRSAGPPRRGQTEHQGLDLSVTVPLALGLQLLMRGDLLLAPLFEARTLTSLLALPAVAGGAIAVLAGGLGRRRALLTGGLVVVLAPGWTVTSTLALTALAAGALFNDKQQPKAVRWAAVALLALLPFWSLPGGLLFVVAALAIATPSIAGASLLLVAVVTVVLLSSQVHHPVVAMRLWFGAVLLVPAAVLAGPDGRWQLRLGAILALAAAIVSRAPEAMAAGIAVAALATPNEGAAATLQRAWCATLVIGTTLLAAYPWVRDDPRGDLLELLGFNNEVSALLALLFLVAGLGFAIDYFRDDVPPQLRRPALLACLLLGFAIARQVVSTSGTTVLVNSYDPATLAAESGSWQRSFPAEALSGVVLDSNLAGGVPIESATETAVVELLADDGTVLAEWPLRVGFETGEWAASRPDLAGRIDFEAPAPWISWVASGGGFFAHRFRSRFTVPASETPPAKASQIRVRRGDDLPPETRLSIYRLELRR